MGGRILALIAALLLTIAPWVGLIGLAQDIVWVRTFERIGPNDCFEYVAEWSDGTYTAAVVDCAGQTVRAGNYQYLGYHEQLAANGCREGVSRWSRGEFTWVPLDCPPGVVYVKPDWDQYEPWNAEDPYGRPPSRAPTRSPRPPATWVRGYPEVGSSGCVDFVAVWSDGSFTATPLECPPGAVERRGGRTASGAYSQLAANGCTEIVTRWSDNSYTWVPLECPPGVVYTKP